jgi:Ser/Thr protein kinase RdoA (MazF antagonist)
MQVHKPGPEMLADLSPANYQTLKILQTQEGLSGRLDGLRRLWKPQAVIHSDIKSDNVLVLPPPVDDGTSPPEIRVVDWETVQIGDPAWDLAGALQDFLLFWVSSMNQTMPTSEEMAASARYPLFVLQPAIRALWRGYRSALNLSHAEANALIRRATSFSAARIIQSAYEMAQHSRDLPVGSVLLLQISANLLADPETGQVQLYGLFQEVGV